MSESNANKYNSQIIYPIKVVTATNEEAGAHP